MKSIVTLSVDGSIAEDFADTLNALFERYGESLMWASDDPIKYVDNSADLSEKVSIDNSQKGVKDLLLEQAKYFFEYLGYGTPTDVTYISGGFKGTFGNFVYTITFEYLAGWYGTYEHRRLAQQYFSEQGKIVCHIHFDSDDCFVDITAPETPKPITERVSIEGLLDWSAEQSAKAKQDKFDREYANYVRYSENLAKQGWSSRHGTEVAIDSESSQAKPLFVLQYAQILTNREKEVADAVQVFGIDTPHINSMSLEDIEAMLEGVRRVKQAAQGVKGSTI